MFHLFLFFAALATTRSRLRPRASTTHPSLASYFILKRFKSAKHCAQKQFCAFSSRTALSSSAKFSVCRIEQRGFVQCSPRFISVWLRIKSCAQVKICPSSCRKVRRIQADSIALSKIRYRATLCTDTRAFIRAAPKHQFVPSIYKSSPVNSTIAPGSIHVFIVLAIIVRILPAFACPAQLCGAVRIISSAFL